MSNLIKYIMYRIFVVFIAFFVLWKAPGCFCSSPSHRSVAVHNLEQNISNLVIEILLKPKPSIDLYESNYLKVLLWKSKYRYLTTKVIAAYEVYEQKKKLNNT